MGPEKKIREVSSQQRADFFLKTVANVVGSEEEAKHKKFNMDPFPCAMGHFTFRGSRELDTKICRQPGVLEAIRELHEEPHETEGAWWDKDFVKEVEKPIVWWIQPGETMTLLPLLAIYYV